MTANTYSFRSGKYSKKPRNHSKVDYVQELNCACSTDKPYGYDLRTQTVTTTKTARVPRPNKTWQLEGPGPVRAVPWGAHGDPRPCPTVPELGNGQGPADTSREPIPAPGTCRLLVRGGKPS